MDRAEEALSATKEAVDLFRSIANVRPDAFRPALAATLDTMAGILIAKRSSKEADAVAREGVTIIEPFAAKYPDVYSQLAAALRKKSIE